MPSGFRVGDLLSPGQPDCTAGGEGVREGGRDWIKCLPTPCPFTAVVSTCNPMLQEPLPRMQTGSSPEVTLAYLCVLSDRAS